MLAGLLLALLGCESSPRKPIDTSVDPAPVQGLAEPWGHAAWDPVTIGRSDAVDSTPVLRDADGVQAPFAPLTDRWGARVHDREFFDDIPGSVWVPDPPLLPGTYTIEAPDGVEEWLGADTHEVLPYGLDTAFDPASVVGRVYALDGARVVEPAGIGSILLAYAGQVRFQIVSVEGDQAAFRIVHDGSPGDVACDVLRATGTLSPTGRFSWSRAAIDAATTPDPTHLENLSLDLGFLADGSEAGGVNGTATADLTPLARHIEGGDPCGLALSLGAICWDCLDEGGASTCLAVTFHAGTLVVTDEVLADELPSCGLDLDETGEALSCEWEGDICAFSALVPFLTLAAARRRKRSA